MMDFFLKRKHGTKGFTIGPLSTKEGGYICYILEDEERPIKIQNKTAIPCGRYQIIINHSTRFNRLLPLLLDVPGYTGIRIHNGRPVTTAADTSGCLLPGADPNYKKGTLVRSDYIFEIIFNLIDKAIKGGEEVWITIT